MSIILVLSTPALKDTSNQHNKPDSEDIFLTNQIYLSPQKTKIKQNKKEPTKLIYLNLTSSIHPYYSLIH